MGSSGKHGDRITGAGGSAALTRDIARASQPEPSSIHRLTACLLTQPSPMSNFASLLTLLDHATVLKRLPRTGWLLNGVAPCESVADHTCGVALLALGLAEQINAGWQDEGLARPLDVGRVITLAVLHDLAESVLTDLPKRSTALIGSDAKHAAEAQAMQNVLAGLPNGRMYVDLWAEYDAAATPEARLVRDADKLEMVHQALHYELAGHRNLDEFWDGHVWRYRLCEQVFETLRLRRK